MLNSIKSINKLGEKHSALETLKVIGGFIGGIGADIAVCCILGHFVGISNMKTFTKLIAKFGIFLFSMKVGEDVENYVYKTVDEFKEVYEEAKADLDTVMEAEGEVT